MPVKTIPARLKFVTRIRNKRTYVEVTAKGYRLMYVNGSRSVYDLPLAGDNLGGTRALQDISTQITDDHKYVRSMKIAAEADHCLLIIELTREADTWAVQSGVIAAFKAAGLTVELAR